MGLIHLHAENFLLKDIYRQFFVCTSKFKNIFFFFKERVVIYNKVLKDKSGNNVQKIMKIGSFNLFEVGTVIESSEIGDYNTFQYRGIFLHIKMSLKIIDFNLFKKLMWKPTAKLIMVAQSELVLEYHRVRD